MNNNLIIKDLSFRYPEAEIWALKDVSLDICQGETLLLTGSSGCGKTTLLKCLNGLVPHLTGGEVRGSVRVDGLNPAEKTVKEMACEVGMVFQDPENQLTQTIVENEIAFGLENRGLSTEEIEKRITSVLRRLEIEELRYRDINTLSGGEKQKVVLASTLALDQKILVLDEPTSQLDPKSASDFLASFKKIASEKQQTIILSEHRIDRVLDFADKIFDLGEKRFLQKKEIGKNSLPKKSISFQKTTNPVRDEILKIDGLSFSYQNNKVLNNISLSIRRGEFVAIVGPNGAGKSTLVKHFNGLLKSPLKKVFIKGRDISNLEVEDLASSVGFVGQNPNDYLFSETVERELEFTLKNLGVGGDIGATLSSLGIDAVRDCFPRDLSGGERQRVALGSILVADPEIIVFDEPTRGLDWKTKENLVLLLNQLRENGKTILLITHDLQLVLSACERVIQLDDGGLVFDGNIQEFQRKLGLEDFD
ncbi:ABC transporter ATP-binding protein [Candidatus Altiarchaeota archaeon]